MSDEASIGGTVDSGDTGVAAFPFYSGPVGIRDRGGWRDVAFFAAPVRTRLPVKGSLDGEPVIITGVRARELAPGSGAARDAPRVIVATVIPSPAG